MKIPRPGIFLGLLAGFVFGVSVVTSAETSKQNGPMMALAMRALLQMIIPVPFFLRHPGSLDLSKKDMIIATLCGIVFALDLFLAYWSYLFISPIECSTILNIQPVVLLLISFFILKEPITRYDVIGVIISLCAVPLVTQPAFLFGGVDSEASGNNRTLGFLLAAGACLLLSITGALTRYIANVNGFVVPFIQGFWIALGSLVIGFNDLSFPTKIDEIIMLLMSCTFGAVGRILLTMAFQREECTIVGALEATELIFISILQYPVNNVKPGAYALIGGALIFTSILIMSLKRKISECFAKIDGKSQEVKSNEHVTYQTLP